MKIYTRKGDGGTTSLGDHRVINKGDPLLELIGTGDELSSLLGLAAAHLTGAGGESLIIRLHLEQQFLFRLGALLSGAPLPDPVVPDGETARMEEEIDGLTEALPPLHSFLLPGGSAAAGLLHLCRSVCRRLERRLAVDYVARPSEGESRSLRPALAHINRLSDYLFVAARTANRLAGVEELHWSGKKGDDGTG